ncbi:tryptophan-rich sensory protein [Corynebacterium gerontici]|uniref:TspO/MBR family protein n=1 Tax=Corynebacterium gerontici TaxID=2079234 RepID=A0A3G6J2H7_9CORY|nr:tryptophan-rich sensory protein [Corynebacterium gerontici]AZA11913.1 TspO/MBR family protein [Corynebacterium gerontici]
MEPTARRAMVTGATGYVGGQLVEKLTQDGWAITALVRSPEKARAASWADRIVETERIEDVPEGHIRLVQGDANNPEDVAKALQGADVTYYLLHSMGAGENFHEQELETARSFAEAVNKSGVPRVVFLGGLHPEGELSDHLESRKQVGEILLGTNALTLCLQAGVVLGSGSASFAMLRHLSERLPGVVAPKWIRNRITPISLRNLLFYLQQAALVDVPRSRTFDIGGPEDVSYIEMLQRYARHFRLGPRPAIVAPVTTPELGAHWIGFVTPVHTKMAKPLIGSLLHDTVVKERDLQEIAGLPPQGLDTLEDAFDAARPDFDPCRWLRVLGGTSVAVVTAAGLATAATRPSSLWLKSLRKPSFYPPQWAFPVIWNLIYSTFTASSALTIGDLGDDANGKDAPQERRSFTALVAANLGLNAAWSWVFFRRKNLPASTAVAAGLCATTVSLTKRQAARDVVRASLTGGYAAWAGFATLLSATLWRKNRRR